MHKSIDFTKFSSIKIGGNIEVNILENKNDYNDTFYLIGSCNNLIIGTQPPQLMILSKKYDYIKIEDNTLKIGAATPSGKISSFCKKNNLADFEFISHLPGTLGGLVYMNAGLKEYEIFNKLIDITTTQAKIAKKDIVFGYRYTNIKVPILEASFELKYGFDENKLAMFKKMRLNQPSTSSAGSCFKNPKNDYAGRLIEAVGLKGYTKGSMEFSKKHANFLLNNGGGTFDDAIYLIQEAQKRVYEKFDIWLECEIGVVDLRYLSDKSPLLHPRVNK